MRENYKNANILIFEFKSSQFYNAQDSVYACELEISSSSFIGCVQQNKLLCRNWTWLALTFRISKSTSSIISNCSAERDHYIQTKITSSLCLSLSSSLLYSSLSRCHSFLLSSITCWWYARCRHSFYVIHVIKHCRYVTFLLLCLDISLRFPALYR